jgi:hypothetical protein
MCSSRVVRLAASIGLAIAIVVARPASADPPRRVARVSYVSGPVSFRPATADEWTTATLNYPVTIGDHLWADRGSRLELELGAAFVRLAPDTEFSVINLDDRLAQLRITQGVLTVRVRALDADDAIEIDTPGGAVSLLRQGFYRIEVGEAGGASAVTVRSGEAEVTAGGGATPVRAQQSLTLTGGDEQWSTTGAPRTDDFEDWCLARDRRLDYSVSARYVPPDMIGYADLDQYGGWQQVADYGPVWIPRVSAEWVPYRYGHWVSIDPWGWTWIDDAPWGFAPFHYGRWMRVSAGWAWMPGRIVAHPVYAPALVAFVGGSGWQASLRVGSEPVAWFPLGPREPFVPAYRVSDAYVQRVNVMHVNVTNVNVTSVTHVNREVPGAVTAVPRDAFVHARPVAAVAIAVPRESIRGVPAAPTASAAPQAASRDSAAGARVAAPPAAATNRPVFVRRAPPDAARTPIRERAAPAAAPAAPAPAVVREPRAQERPQAPAPPASAPSAPPARLAPNADAGLAARHAQERVDLDARHNAERAQLQARHQAEERGARDPKQRQEIQRQHQQEQRAMQDRHKQERDAVQKRQDQERGKKGG